MERTTTRRHWLDWLVGTSLGALALAILYPLSRYIVPPPAAEAETNRVLAAKRPELPPNSGKVFRFGAQPAIVIDTPGGDVRAFSAVCTHLACTVHTARTCSRSGAPATTVTTTSKAFPSRGRHLGRSGSMRSR